MSKGLMEALGIAFALIALLVVVGVVMNMTNTATQQANEVSDTMTKTIDSAMEAKYTALEGQEISGSKVLSLLKDWQNDEISLVVTTKSGKSTTYFYNEDRTRKTDVKLADAKKKSNPDQYINPSGIFEVSIGYDDNEVINVITFTQVSKGGEGDEG